MGCGTTRGGGRGRLASLAVAAALLCGLEFLAALGGGFGAAVSGIPPQFVPSQKGYKPPAHRKKKYHFNNLYTDWVPKSFMRKKYLAAYEPPPKKNADRRLGSVDRNLAVADVERLASEPLQLRLDRNGKSILPGEEESFRKDVQWSRHDVFGRSSARAPRCDEEFWPRYNRPEGDMRRESGLTVTKRFEEEMQNAKDDLRIVRTFSWQGEKGRSPIAIMLIGVTETSGRSRKLAARAVYEGEPSALVVQLCKERIGRHLVMPTEHLETVASYGTGYGITNPEGFPAEVSVSMTINDDMGAMKAWMQDLAYADAVNEFVQLPADPDDKPKVLCLGDVRQSRLIALRKQQGNETLNKKSTLSVRSKQLARGLVSLAGLGHKRVLGVVDAAALPTLTTWLERAGARMLAVADASDIEQGRESLAADMRLPAEAGPQRRRELTAPPAQVLGFGRGQLGFFIGAQGLEALWKRRQRLLKTTRVKDLVRERAPAKTWHVAELLGGEGPVPGPGALLQDTGGLRFWRDRLEIPDDYLRDAGMEGYAPKLWKSMVERGVALESRDAGELLWWVAGSPEDSRPNVEDGGGDDDEGGGFSAASTRAQPVGW